MKLQQQQNVTTGLLGVFRYPIMTELKGHTGEQSCQLLDQVPRFTVDLAISSSLWSPFQTHPLHMLSSGLCVFSDNTHMAFVTSHTIHTWPSSLLRQYSHLIIIIIINYLRCPLTCNGKSTTMSDFVKTLRLVFKHFHDNTHTHTHILSLSLSLSLSLCY